MLIGFDLVENGSGVYALYLEDNLVYLGSTDNLRQKFGDALNYIRAQKAPSRAFQTLHMFYERSYTIEIKVLERIKNPKKALPSYIEKFSPIFNRRKVPSFEETLEIFGIEEKPLPTPKSVEGAAPQKLTEKGKKVINRKNPQTYARQKIESLLKEKNISYETQISFGNCRSKNGYPLFFDFFLEGFNCFIEVIYPRAHDKELENFEQKKKFCREVGAFLLEIKSEEIETLTADSLEYQIKLLTGTLQEF